MTNRRGRAWLLGGIAGAFAIAGGRAAGGEASLQDDLSRLHYAAAERELASADTSRLDPARRESRSHVIEALRAYRERGEFGENTDFPGARVPYFVDDGGRRCAVAQLLHATGDDGVVARVARTANHAWVADLAEDAEFRSWLDVHGLTIEEAARIQRPPVYRGGGQSSGSTQPTVPGKDASGTSGSSGGADSGGRSAGSSTPDEGAASTGGAASGGRAAEPRRAGADVGSWRIWWEYSKLDFVEAHPLRIGGGLDARFSDALLAARRKEAVETFTAALTDTAAAVRSTAVIALGRVAGEPAVTRIVPLLEDPDRLVRENAILALGATGSPAGAKVLATLVREGRVGRSPSGAPSAEVRALALVSLGIARRCGLDASLDVDVAKILEDAKKRDLADVGVGAFVHDLLAQDRALDESALRAAADVNDPDAERARAVETLGRRHGEKVASAALRNVVGDRRVDVRRAAAVALGDSQDPLASAQAATAYEIETEPLTRGLMLVSLGRMGGRRSLDLLRGELANGPAALRPWAALGLGLMARATGDADARAALRTADVPATARGALWLAQGLARDAAAAPTLATALAESTNPLDRIHAATALALVGGDDARVALVRAAATEQVEYVRVVIAWGLGVIGDDADVPAIFATLDGVQDADLDGVAAVGLGLHGGEECLNGALRRAAKSESPAARSAAIDAAGLLLSRSPGLLMHEVSRRTNYAVMPRWLQSALGNSL